MVKLRREQFRFIVAASAALDDTGQAGLSANENNFQQI
jgi:hypothetical protein